MKPRMSSRWSGRGTTALLLSGSLLVAWWLPLESARFQTALASALDLVRWYTREHVILCLVPAFFIAGAISVFIRKESVLRLLGPAAPRWLAYGVASVSGTVLAVCSCTVLPLFAGIHKRGAGLGPAVAFLYSGPAINVLAIILTARILGWELGLARTIGAVGFSVILGLLMAWFWRHSETSRSAATLAAQPASTADGSTGRGVRLVLLLMAILVAANWSGAAEPGSVWAAIHAVRWPVVAVLAALLGLLLNREYGIGATWLLAGGALVAGLALFSPLSTPIVFLVGVGVIVVPLLGREDETADWLDESWGYAVMILPLLLAGVFVSGLLLGGPGGEGLVPAEWVARSVGGNSVLSNLFASVSGALMYFATLTEIPILQGLLSSGMGQGPALALLLAGPAVSLPSLLVLHRILGAARTVVFAGLVVVLSTVAGIVYGLIQ
jgi:uncharacterized membrane protein YraQ (UPF0718 family)